MPGEVSQLKAVSTDGISRPKSPFDRLKTLELIESDNLDQVKSKLELRKLAAEAEKSELERDQLRDGVSKTVENASFDQAALERRKLEAETEKSELERDQLRAEYHDENAMRNKVVRQEADKLRLDIQNARLSPLLEIAKAIIPAVSIIVSIYLAGKSLEYQRDKDQAAAISQQLASFNKEMMPSKDAPAGSELKALFDEPRHKAQQKVAIAALRSLGKHAIPSLVANLSIEEYSTDAHSSLQTAILELYAIAELRPAILQELVSSIRSAARRKSASSNELDPALARYLKLTRECLRQIENSDAALFREWWPRATALLADIRQHLPVTEIDEAFQ